MSISNAADPLAQNLARNLRILRAARDWDATQMAMVIGCSPSSVHGWERGTTMPRRDTLALMAARLGVTQDWLLHNDPRALLPEPPAEPEPMAVEEPTVTYWDASDVDRPSMAIALLVAVFESVDQLDDSLQLHQAQEALDCAMTVLARIRGGHTDDCPLVHL